MDLQWPQLKHIAHAGAGIVVQQLFAAQVHLLVRGGKMRASGAMQDRVLSHPNVEVHFNVSVDDVVGDAKGLTGLKIRHSESGAALPGANNMQYQRIHAFWADESIIPSYEWCSPKPETGTEHPEGTRQGPFQEDRL